MLVVLHAMSTDILHCVCTRIRCKAVSGCAVGTWILGYIIYMRHRFSSASRWTVPEPASCGVGDRRVCEMGLIIFAVQRVDRPPRGRRHSSPPLRRPCQPSKPSTKVV